MSQSYMNASNSEYLEKLTREYRLGVWLLLQNEDQAMRWRSSRISKAWTCRDSMCLLAWCAQKKSSPLARVTRTHARAPHWSQRSAAFNTCSVLSALLWRV